MTKKPSLFLLSAFALCVGLLLGSQLVEQGASAQRTNPASRQDEWEYCAAQITVVYATENTKSVGVGQICYFKSSGAKCERVDTMVDGTLSNSFGVAKADTWAKIISKLGDDGWQLVAEGPWLVTQSEDKSLYFRKPKLN